MLYQTVLVQTVMHELSMLLCKHCPSAFYGVMLCYVMLCYYYFMKEVTPSAEAGINGEP